MTNIAKYHHQVSNLVLLALTIAHLVRGPDGGGTKRSRLLLLFFSISFYCILLVLMMFEIRLYPSAIEIKTTLNLHFPIK